MVKITRGDILSCEVEALVNTVNCIGVMGRGIALQFKKAFPDNFVEYQTACDRNEVIPGRMLVHVEGITFPRYIINFPTKMHWKGRSKIEYIDSGLDALVAEINRLSIKSIAIPPLGCGLGGLLWSDVRPRIENALAECNDVEVLLFEPNGAPDSAAIAKTSSAPRMTLSRAILIVVMAQYLSALMDVSMSLLEIQKAMYLMQEAGYDLRLRFKKAAYGPYAENMRHVLNAIEGHFISGFGDGADDPSKPIILVNYFVPEARKMVNDNPELTRHLHRLTDLLLGFESPYGMELLATVHWVATRENATTPDRAFELVQQWNERKRMFPERHIVRAWEALQSKNWIGHAASAQPFEQVHETVSQHWPSSLT